MRIYLTGYMGSGKSTVGRKLAVKLDYCFLDLDSYIERKFFKSIPDIFAEEGETGFRLKEQKALHEVAQFTNVVIATGGGAPCFFDNMQLMNDTGTTIFLDPPTGVLADRLMKSKTERPLIKGKSKEELITFIDETLQKRRPFYEQAQFHMESTGQEIETLMKLLTGNINSMI